MVYTIETVLLLLTFLFNVTDHISSYIGIIYWNHMMGSYIWDHTHVYWDSKCIHSHTTWKQTHYRDIEDGSLTIMTLKMGHYHDIGDRSLTIMTLKMGHSPSKH